MLRMMTSMMLMVVGLAGMASAGLQSARVTGTLVCATAAKGDQAWLQLYDDDLCRPPCPAHSLCLLLSLTGGDDAMAELTVEFDEFGKAAFDISGAVSNSWGTIDPIFKVDHNCNDMLIPCTRQYRTEIPKSYVTKNATPEKTFVIGDLNLELKVCPLFYFLRWNDRTFCVCQGQGSSSSEERDCI